MADPVISVAGLRKSYDGFEAVRGIDLEVGAGEIFAFLGPNGAGKTTTVEILEGYRHRTAGEVSVLGRIRSSADRDWRQRVGFVLQESRLVPELTPREAVEQYAGYYAHPRDVDETVGLVGLEEKADVRTSKLSGGQQRRLDVALALIGDPELLFLDEPTTGFDPSARRQAWDVIAGLREHREDGLPDDPLHGRGAGPRRPRRDHLRRADRRDRHARVPRATGRPSAPRSASGCPPGVTGLGPARTGSARPPGSTPAQSR